MGPVSLLFICCLLYQVYDINALRNVAFNKSTYQSSSPQTGGDSFHAVDNNTDSDFNNFSCTHTGFSAIEWWCVDLQHVYIINDIKLYNRDALQERLRGFTMKLSNLGQCNEAGLNSTSPCYIDTSQENHPVYNITECNQPSSTSLSGRFVFIQNRPYQALTLCEVQIFKGGCPNGTFGEDCDKQCNINCKDRLCNSTTGTCNTCIQGYYGTTCQYKCSDGCTNNNCNKDNGTCTCKSGFTGDRCENCQQGKYGDDCQQDCSIGCKDHTCSRSDGTCPICTRGWFDAGCGSPCVVTNCIGSCNKTTGHCNSCNNGWYGTNCERSCSEGCLDNNCSKSEGTCPSCMTGWFDERCNSSCLVTNCIGNCNKTTGKCSTCHDGFYGTNCQQDCSNGCLNHTCSKSNGTCPVCTSGWFDERCNSSCLVTNCIGNCNKTTGKCSTCHDGFYGTNCQQDCSNGCLNHTCSKSNGTCPVCTSGWFDERCNSSCLVTNCIGNCNKTTGKCSTCHDRFYGTNCQQDCSNGCLNHTCSKSNGTCPVCTPGWFDERCNSSCLVTNCIGNCNKTTGKCSTCHDGFYGTNCQQDCSNGCLNHTCSKSNGTCPVCTSGWFDERCNASCVVTNCIGNCNKTTGQCNTCDQGWFGENCGQKCNDGCLNNICTKSDGSCDQCNNGWFGISCGSRCSSNCTAGCDKSNGTCIDCKPDTVGPYCNSTCGSGCQPITGNITCNRDGRCTSCIMGRYGDRCNNNCNITCNGGCDRYNGTCINGCIKGKSGEYCDKNCNDNCIHCKQDNINSCTQCKDGRWGTSCQELCSVNCKSQNASHCNGTVESCSESLCDRSSGACPNGCVVGKKGDNCTDDCSAGYYGDNCANTCGRCARGTPCNTTSGNCGSVGCEDGFIGLMCSQAAPMHNGEDPAIVPAVVSAVIVAVLIAVVVVVFMYRRKHKQKEDKNIPFTVISKTDSSSEINPVDATVKTEDADEGSNEVVMYSNLPNSSVYENLPSTRIELKYLWEIIQRKKMTKAFKPEYENLPKGLCSPHDVCLNEVNRPKNRYKNICAFDHTRVKLEIENDDPTSDYVNACYITGYGNTKNKYIASQGPNDVNINEFMRLIWDVKTGTIAMVTNPQELGHVKCLIYWPTNGKLKTFKKISVKLLAEDVFAHFIIRTLQITKEGCDPRTIKHYHYTSWPDKGVPADASSLVEFRNKVNKSPTSHPGPMIVHCSAGIGRTGTYLALDYLIEEGKAEGSVDVVKCISRMRTERINMVQTLDQYVFLHKAILEWYIAGNVTTSIAHYKTMYQSLLTMQTSGKCLLEQKFEMMKAVSPVLTKDDCYTACLDENKNKNRSMSILAGESARPFLVIASSDDNATDYINAVYISSYRKKQAYILTQTPLPNTVIDFWRMVIQTESYIIVDLDHGQEISRDIGRYLPETKLMCGDCSINKSGDTQNEEDYSIVTYKINKEEDANVNQTVKVYTCKFWNDQQQTPESFISLINVLEHVKSSNDNSNPLTVVCRDGVTKGGIFCVLSAILERLTIEQEVSVLQTILQLRASRPQIITSYEQLRFCFDAIDHYLEHYTTYVNVL